MDSKRKNDWSTDKNLKQDNHCFYQQKYPIRLPKLKETLPSQKDLGKRMKKTIIYDEEEEKIPSANYLANMIFERRFPQNTEEQDQILKETENLHLEDYLDEDVTVEHFDFFQAPQPKFVRGSESKRNGNTILKTNGSFKRNENALQHLTREKSRKFSLPTKSNQHSREIRTNFHLESRPFSGKSRRTLNVRTKTNDFAQNFLNTVKRNKESSIITSIRSNAQNKKYMGRSKTTDNTLQEKALNSNNQFYKHTLNANETNSDDAESVDCKILPKEDYACLNRNDCQKTTKNMDENKDEKSDITQETHTEKNMSASDIHEQNFNNSKTAWFKTIEENEQLKFLEDKNKQFLPRINEDYKLEGIPISYHVAKLLRLILFGNLRVTFNEEWRDQQVDFYQNSHYGLKFYKNSPVEMMVSLQAYVMKQLLFVNMTSLKPDLLRRLSPSKIEQERVLVLAICDMIWKAGGRKHAVVALPIGKCLFTFDSSYKEDFITEKMEFFKFTSSDEFEQFIIKNIKLFKEPNKNGCISLLYSLMLSRGLTKLVDDFIKEKQYGMLEILANKPTHCSQELINLCIYGKAVSHVHNGLVEKYDHLQDKFLRHKGIEGRNDIGYLDHRENTNGKEYQVGSRLKTPLYPIWLLQYNNKLTVVFSLKKELLNDWKLERRFDLYHYQGLPRFIGAMDTDIKLTIDTILPLPVTIDEEEEPSFLEETIRTKWSDAVIEWNGYNRF